MTVVMKLPLLKVVTNERLSRFSLPHTTEARLNKELMAKTRDIVYDFLRPFKQIGDGSKTQIMRSFVTAMTWD